MNEAAAAYENAVRRQHLKASIVRALALWETWIVVASIAYIVSHLIPWALTGFRVVGQ